MNEYQEALDRIKTNYCIGNCNDAFKINCDCPFQKDIDTLQELVDQTKQPTPEEVKQEWEQAGYEWYEYDGKIILKQQIQYTNKFVIITINLVEKAYWKRISDNLNFIPFLLKEHQLLNKTFRALGWI